MPAIRKLPSGKWQASVRLPDGTRVTKSAPLRQTVALWAKEQEAEISKGNWANPRSGRTTYADWSEIFMAARRVEPETLRGDKAIMSNHIVPYFGKMSLAEIRPTTIQQWLKQLEKDGVGQGSRVRAFNLFRTSMKIAASDELISSNPCDRVTPPKQNSKSVEWFTPKQIELICAELDDRDRAMVLLMAWVGLRWGECAGLRVGDIDWMRRIVSVDQVTTQSGRIKDGPKTETSQRKVPAPAHVIEAVSPFAAGKRSNELLFVTPNTGKPLNGPNWRKKWYRAIEDANAKNPDVDIPAYPPHASRHTAASWLAQAGVPLKEIQQLLGHSTPTMTNRYAHLVPGAHGAVESAWKAMSRNPEETASHG